MPNPEVRYCTTEDGVKIAYCVEGEGPPLLLCPPFVWSFSLDHLVPSWKAVSAQMGQGRQLVRYDMRGTGLSQRDASDFSGPALVLEIDAVVRAAGLKRFALLGAILAGPRAIAYAAQHPQRVTHLILHDTFAGMAEAYRYDAWKALAELARTNWNLAAETLAGFGLLQHVADPSKRQTLTELALQVARITEQSTEGRVAASLMLEAYESWDVGHLLGQVRAKTLVFHHLDNMLFPVSVGRQLAAAIPGAVFVPLEGVNAPSGFDPDETQAVLSVANRFLGKRRRAKVAAAPQASLRTVLFTDLVGHTEMMQRLGDEQGRAVLREHERITREVLKQHGGAEVKTMGDGFMASFGSVTKAVECAIALQKAFDAWNRGEGGAAATPDPRPTTLSIRVGLNAGEPIAEEGDLFGSTVILASRVAAQAGAGEILIPEPVRHLLAGKDFLFSDRGEVALKGFEDAVRLYEVRWRDDA